MINVNIVIGMSIFMLFLFVLEEVVVNIIVELRNKNIKNYNSIII